MSEQLAFLVTDIEGSTSRWDRFPEAMAAALAAHDRILTEAVAGNRGTVFKHTGDGILAAFRDVFAAVRAAEIAQHDLADHDWGKVGELRVRMGIDVGDAEFRAGDYYGPPLNRAARLMSAGHGGQVLVSDDVHAELVEDPPSGIQLRRLGEHRLRGFSTTESVYQLVFVGLPAEFPPLRLDAAAALDHGGLGLSTPGYRIRGRIGDGAYGMVYRAYQPSVGREVAVKVIRPDLASRPSFVRRFEAEARTIARLAHPRIVPLHDFWRDTEGAYLVMQLLPGGNLARALASGTMGLTSGIRYVRHVAEALAHAHDRGVVHGDLKPANVLLDGAGNAYLSDFGIAARLLDPAEIGTRASSAPAYRAPEEPVDGPTRRGDLFALGILAFQVLTGRSPPVGAPLPPASEIAPPLPAGIDQVLARATATDPDERYETVADFLAAFDAAIGDLTELAPVTPAVLRNPFKGLRPFDEADAGDFYGRDELVASLVAAVGRLRFVTVIGPSGCGKSSAVRAGLLPALRDGAVEGSEQWFIATMSPGDDPQGALIDTLEGLASSPIDLPALVASGGLTAAADAALGDNAGELLVVIDQFEELFTLVDDPDRRQDFLDLLSASALDAHSRVRIVATLRADFYGHPLAVPGIDRLVRDGLVTVLRPTQDELVDMITRPALAVGLRWEPGLPPRIAQDVHDQSGALPLLQYALTELVERRSGDVLTGADYEALGGATGALAARAEAVCNAMTPAQQSAARQVLLRLVTVGEDTDDTRRRVRRSELEDLDLDHDDLDVVLDALISTRLLITDRDPTTRGPTVEVAHEALLTRWPRLRGWIDGQREALILGRRLRTAMAEWEDADRNDDYLLTGDRLAPFRGWEAAATLTTEERSFLDASIAKERRDEAARVRRRRILTGILAGAAVVAVVLAGLAVLQWRRADESAAFAEDQALLAEEQAALAGEQAALAEEQAEETEIQRQLALEQAELAREAAEAQAELAAEARARELATAAASLDGQPELAILLALEAVGVEVDGGPVGVAVDALHRAVVSSPVRGRVPADIVAADRSGRFLVTGLIGRLDMTYPTVWDRATGEGRSLPIPDAWVGLGEPEDGVTAVAVREDGGLVAVGLTGGGVVVFDAGTLEEVWTTNDRQAVWTGAGTGMVVLTFGDAATDPFPVDANAATVEEALEDLDSIDDVTVSGAGTEDDPWIVEIGEHRAPFTHTLVIDPAGFVEGRGHQVGPDSDGVRHLAFHPDGARLASAALDGTRLWDLGSDAVLGLPGFPRAGLAFSPDGSLLAGGWPDMLGAGRGQATAVVWDVDSGAERYRLPSVDREVTGVAFGPDGAYLAVSYADEEIGLGLWDLADGRESSVYEAEWNRAVAIDAAGTRIAAGGDLFEVEGSGVRLIRRLTTSGVLGLTFDTAGSLVGNLDTGDAIVWDLSAAGAGELLTVAAGTRAANGIAVGSEGRLLAAGEGDEYRVIDAATGDDLMVVRPGPGLIAQFGLDTSGADYRVVDAAFTPDDRLLATAVDHIAGRGGAVMVWEVESGDLVAVLGDPTHPRGGFSVSFNPDGSLLAASVNGAVVVWDTSAYQEMVRIPATAALWWASVSFGPDGTRLAARAEGIDDYLASFGNHVAVFDLEGNRVLRCCDHDPPEAGRSVVTFSPDGTMLLTNGRPAGGAYEAALWDAGSGDRIGTLGPLNGLVRAAAFSPDGSRIAIGDGSRVRIFDTDTRTMLATLPVLDDDSQVTDLVFGPDGTTLAAALEGEGLVRVFALDVDDLIDIATGRLTRSFTSTECRIYAIDPCPTLEEIRTAAG